MVYKETIRDVIRKKIMGNFGVSLIDFIIPRFCPSCKTRLPAGSSFICNECLANIKRADQERLESEFNRKFSDDGIISAFTSCFVFEKEKKLQQIIHSLKYEKKFLLGVFLGSLVGERINREFSQYRIDKIVPVPLHHLKKAEREFNQSLYIAKGISKVTGIRVGNRQIKRKRYTESQTTMNLTQREKNISGAFVSKKKLDGDNILIVDDVITTGSTVRECGRVLLEAGADKIYAASVAIAD
jgi:ComF family protein